MRAKLLRNGLCPCGRTPPGGLQRPPGLMVIRDWMSMDHRSTANPSTGSHDARARLHVDLVQTLQQHRPAAPGWEVVCGAAGVPTKHDPGERDCGSQGRADGIGVMSQHDQDIGALPLTKPQLAVITRACSQHHVSRLDVFGSLL